MSVLINSMNIPKSCSDCPLNYDEMSCAVTGTRWWSDTMVLLDFDYTKERLHDCPLSEVPSAQPKRNKGSKGKWIRITQGQIPEQYICPFCHRTIETYGIEELLSIRYPYCHCGADMRGKNNGRDS